MGRWLIGLVLGLLALGAVFFLWQRESAQKTETAPAPHEAPMDAGPANTAPAAPSPAETGTPGAASPETPATEPSASAESIIVVDEPWARTASANGTTAAYMLMTNTSQTPDRITAVSSPDAAEAMIHETRIDSKNVATMKPAAHVDLDPGVPLVFEPGGLHVMLTGLKHPLKEGDQLTVVFTFQHAGTLHVKVPVGEQQTDGDSVQP